MIRGVDISEVQQNVDFQWLFNQGFRFVIVKCYTGNDGRDPLYLKNLAGAKAAGLKVGIYNFIYPLPPDSTHPGRDPKAQAKLHYEAAGDQQVVCCDLEWPEFQDWTKWGCSATQIVQWAVEYLEAYEKLSGVRPIVYTYPYFAKSINLPDWFGQKYKLWIASYQDNAPSIPKPWTDWVLWQDSGGTKEKLSNGIPVDTNKSKDLSLWDPPAPVTVPEPPTMPSIVVSVEPVPVPPTVPEPAPIVPIPDPTPANGNWISVLSQIIPQIIQFILKLLGKKTQ